LRHAQSDRQLSTQAVPFDRICGMSVGVRNSEVIIQQAGNLTTFFSKWESLTPFCCSPVVRLSIRPVTSESTSSNRSAILARQ
jgi:hypothetical protein